jgi:uncharacterized YkwD family protein
MNLRKKLLVITLVVAIFSTLWTGFVVAAPTKVEISVRTNFGNFSISIPVDTSADKLADEIYQQALAQIGPNLSKQYGSQLGQAIVQSIARQLAPQVKQILDRQPTPKPDPKPEPKPDPKPDPKPEPKPDPEPAGLTADEAQMLKLINQERVQRGLKPLSVDLAVTAEARKKSQDMITNNYFGHTSPTYGSPFTQLSRAGISYRAAGENLAGAPTVDRAHTALMNSPGHRANILNASYTHVGIGIIDGGPYGKMYTQMFIQK